MTLRYFKEGATNASRALQACLILIGAAARKRCRARERPSMSAGSGPYGRTVRRNELMRQWCLSPREPADWLRT